MASRDDIGLITPADHPPPGGRAAAPPPTMGPPPGGAGPHRAAAPPPSMGAPTGGPGAKQRAAGPPPNTRSTSVDPVTGRVLTPEEQELQEKKAIRKDCCKRAAKFTFTQVGLCTTIILYAVAGGFIFEHLESTNEYQECVQGYALYQPIENDTINKMWIIATNYPSPLDASFAITAIRQQLSTFRDNVLALGYDGTNCTAMNLPNGPGYKWSFPGSLLFSTTVFTTVGYGNIAPKTFWGRLVCIAYAVLGIPLMLLCLSNIGEIMADVFRYTYINVCCFGFCAKGNPKQNSADSLQQSETDNWKDQYNKSKQGRGPELVDDPEDDEDEDEEQKISVPLTITMLLIASYLFLGALLFGVWDGWDWLTSAYFCFVTIATIGFGDVVPGTSSFNTIGGQLEMVGTAVYMVLGMAILSMAFNLIQEEIVSKFQWLGEKLGLSKREEDEDEVVEETQPPTATGAARFAAPPPMNRYPPGNQLGTGNRSMVPGRVAGPPPNMFHQAGKPPGGPMSGGPMGLYGPPPRRMAPPAFPGGAPPTRGVPPPGSLGPNAMFQPPMKPHPEASAAYHP